MVQTHVGNTNRKKRNVLSRSKLLLQVFALRENNKILAKAVAEKALKITELENEGLSFKNIKLESRESIKSLREYVLNLESMVKKAVSELSGVVNRFTSILSSTKIEKQNVEYLSNLISSDNPPSSPEIRGLRGRNVKSQDSHSKSHERKKHRSSIKRVHPMNLQKSVCVLETLKETNDTSLETKFCEKNVDKDHVLDHTIASIKSEEIVTKQDVKDECASNTHSQGINTLSINPELSRKSSDVHPISGLVGTIKREIFNSKPESITTLDNPVKVIKRETFNPKSESITTLHNPVKVIKKPHDIVPAVTSPRKLRPRKSLNYADMLNSRPSNGSTHNHHSSRTIADSEDRENKLGRKNAQENTTGKKSTKKSSSTLPAQHMKEESVEDTENIETDTDFKCLEGLKIKHLQHMISKLHGTRASGTKHYSKRSSNNSTNVRKCSDITNVSYNDESLTNDSFNRILHILNVKKGHPRSHSHHENSEKEHGRQSSVPVLPQIGTEGSVSIKHEIISPRK